MKLCTSAQVSSKDLHFFSLACEKFNKNPFSADKYYLKIEATADELIQAVVKWCRIINSSSGITFEPTI